MSRVGWGFLFAGSLLVACNAILGVEDVRLARAGDGGFVPDEADVPEAGAPDDGGEEAPAAEVDLALGFFHTCARKLDGTVRCWGGNTVGELGDGVPLDGGTRPPALVPQPVVGISDAVAIASGIEHSCVVRRDGTAACWGFNNFGQLGDGTTNDSSTPMAVQGLSDAVGIAAGGGFTCATLRSGGVSCWGRNDSGQLGDGTKDNRPTAAAVAQLSNAVAIAVATYHACAIVAGGTVKCWGGNGEGQLGNGSTNESLTPAAISSLSDVVQIAAASRFSCARQRSGQVYCWGANDLGQLGNGVPNSAPNPSPVLTAVSDATSIWVGYEHACAARRGGEVVCWGRAAEGQIGSGPPQPDASVATPTAVVGVGSALAVATGGDHACATTRSGEVFCWGANSQGQVGDGTTDPAYTASKVGGFP